MRTLAALLAVLLLVTICSVAGARLGDSSITAPVQMRAPSDTMPGPCCFKYASHRIPLRLIHSAYWTSESCPKPAVVLVTISRKNICVDPEASWVQKHLKYLDLLKH